MKNFFLLVAVYLVPFTYCIAQGTVRGKVTDKNGEAVIGAPVVLSTIHSTGTTTDLDGNYTLKISDSTEQTIVVSYIGFETVKKTVHPQNGEVVILNFVLSSSTQEIKEVEVTAKAVKAREYYMEKIKEKSATTLDYVSSETMRKTGDVNVTTAVARVAGVSTNGAFITVRGIGDRYVKTAINGSRIPTLDPFTNNIKLDLFPASLIDNVIITKTQSPDLPGDWAGAFLSIETKDYPDQLNVNVETSFGYNEQSTFKNVLSSQRSSTDWLGYDNNLRDHDHSTFHQAVIHPSDYEQLVVLDDLGAYFNSLGVTKDNWMYDGANGNTYYRLALVQLNLLDPALINDQDAYTIANNKFLDGPYRSDAFKIINANVPETGKSFANNWNTTTRKAPLNFSQSFSIGDQFTLFGKPLGVIAGYRYNSGTLYDPASTANRASVSLDNSTQTYIPGISSKAHQQESRETNGWSALINTAYKLNSNNSVSLLFMPNFTGVNKVRDAVDAADPLHVVFTKSQFYEQRKQLVYQFKSEHYIPGPKLKIELNASYTNGKSSAPDFKNLQYQRDTTANGYLYLMGNQVKGGIHRYYRYLTDNLFDSRLSFEIPIGSKPELPRKVKIGVAYQKNDRKNDQYDYEAYNSVTSFTDLDLDTYFDPDNFNIHSYTDPSGYQASSLDLYYLFNTTPADHTFGRSNVKACFGMIDFAIIPRLRISGGLRVEKAYIYTDVAKYDSLGLAPGDPRRDYSNGSQPAINPGKLDEVSYLPSANLIYKIKESEDAPINLRLNYSESVARPSIRELSDIALVDFEYNAFVFGNSDLKMVRIKNYDIRGESYFKSGDNLSVSVFYKDFKNHIELVNSGGYTWQNVDKNSWVRGVEVEGKKIITRHFDISANITLAQSRSEVIRKRLEISGGVKNLIPVDTLTRPMFGQAPYVVNTILSYTTDKPGLTAAVSYNIQGKRLVIVSDNHEIPDNYELPRNLIDIKITKKIGKHFSTSITVRDVLDTPIVRNYNYTNGTELDYDRYTFGRTYNLGVSYKL